MNKVTRLYLFALFIFTLGAFQMGLAQHGHIKINPADVPMEQIKNECKFFSGDTLNGFPLEATIELGIKKFDIYSELKWFVGTKEIEFVKNKYNLKTLPQEIISERKTVPTILSASCNNVDFEAGTFAGWTGGIGYNSNSNTALTITNPAINTLGINSPETGCSFHTLMTAAGGTDPWGGFPVLDPGGGAYAVRLGGENINTNNYVPAGCTVTHPSGNPSYYSNGESLQQTFLVTPNNTLLTYNYAVVLEKAPHSNGQQPYFRVEVLDQNNAEIPCLNYYVQGDSAGTYPPGFVDVGGAEALSWQTSSLNLLPYLGQNITVRFTSAGCIPGGHFGYGYVDCACAPLEIIIPTFACQGGIDSLIAPPVAGSTYAWTGPGITSGTTSQVITANVGGTYSVTITNALGCSYTLDTSIVFHPNPTVTVNSPTICAGGTTTLTATSTGSAGALTYTWSPSTGLNFSPGDSVATITPPASTTFSVTGTSVQGCTNTAVANITVNSSPPPTFTATPVCAGFITTFTNTTTGGSIYDWNFGDLTTLADTSQLQNPTYTYPAAGNYAVSFSVTTAAGCKSNTTQTVTVNPLPTASFNALPVCLNNASVFTSTITNGSTYLWDYGDPTGNPIAGSATPSHTYATAGTFAVTLTVTSTNGCTVTANNNAVVNPLPTPAFSVAPVCLGSGSVFNNTSVLDSACTWNFGSPGNPATANSNCTPTFTYASSGTFPVTLTVTASGGCKATTTGVAIVNPFPVLGFTANHPCDGSPVNFTNTTNNQATISNWHWDFGNGDSSNLATPPAYTYTAPAGFSAAGCYSVVLTATASTGCSGSHDTIVYVHNNPFAYFNAFEACLGTASEFLDSSFVQNPGCLNDHITNWNWDFGDAQTSSYTATNLPDTVKHTYANCGPYNITLTVTTNNNCTNVNTLTGDTVFCLPTVAGPNNFTVCPGAATPVQTFTTTCANGGTPTAEWFQSLANVNNTGAPPNFLNPGGFDQVPSYNAIAQNLNCSLLKDTVFAVAISGVGCIGNVVNYVANVYPTPTVTPTNDIIVCQNVAVPAITFTGCPGTPTETFTWSTTNSGPNIGLAATGSGNIASFPAQNGTDVPAISTISVTPLANGCTGPAASFSITVNPLPTMTVTSPAPYCPGALISSTDYTITTDPANAGVTYTWTATNNTGTGMPATGIGAAPNTPYNAPTNSSLVNQNSIITYTPSLNGCIGSPATETVVVKPTPFVDPIPPAFYCPNQVTNPVNFTCQPTGGTPVFSYTVPGGLGQSGTGDLPSFTTNNPGTTNLVTTFTVNATLNNCPGPNSTFNITVYPNPVAKFIYKPLVCVGSPMLFTDESVAYGGLTLNSWQWDMDDNGTIDASGQTPQYLFPTAGPDSVKLYVATSSVPSCTAQTTEPVFVNPKPVADFTGVNLQGCPNPVLSTTFTPQATISLGNIVSWNWSFGNGNTSTAQYPQPQNYTNTSATIPAYYSVSLAVKSDSGCADSKTKNNYVEVYPTPIANFSWGPTDADIDQPTIHFVNEAIGASPYLPSQVYGQYGVEYYMGDNYASGTDANYVYNNTIFNHSYNDPDVNDVFETYYVTQWVINSYGCRDSITKPVEIQPIFTFYIPNAFTPTGDGKNDGFKGIGMGINNSTYNLWVFDRWGLMIFHADDIDKPWDGHMRGDDSKPVLQEDVYVWKVEFNDIFGKLHQYHGTVTLVK